MPDDHQGEGSAPRQISAEHRRLGALLSETRVVLSGVGDGPAAREALARLTEALETHLIQEESLYYPTIWALRPALKPLLRKLVGSHPALRVLLAAVAQALEGESMGDARRRFDQFVDFYGEHKRAEEEVLHSVDEAIAQLR